MGTSLQLRNIARLESLNVHIWPFFAVKEALNMVKLRILRVTFLI